MGNDYHLCAAGTRTLHLGGAGPAGHQPAKPRYTVSMVIGLVREVIGFLESMREEADDAVSHYIDGESVGAVSGTDPDHAACTDRHRDFCFLFFFLLFSFIFFLDFLVFYIFGDFFWTFWVFWTFWRFWIFLYF